MRPEYRPPRGCCDARIAILDYGMATCARSQRRSSTWVRRRSSPTTTAVMGADGIVLPAWARCRRPWSMRRLGLAELLHERVAAGTPLIGVCMGMQLLFGSTTEHGGAEGIGLLEGAVAELDAPGLKVPQIGWNPVSWRRATPLNAGLPDPCAFYHANCSRRVQRGRRMLGTAEYGGQFVSAVARPPLYGVQFHPEKSGSHGLRLLGNFVRGCLTARPPRRGARGHVTAA